MLVRHSTCIITRLYVFDCLLAKDIGASQLITEGKIKLKNDSAISHFNENSIEFEDGSTLAADVVIFSTGCV